MHRNAARGAGKEQCWETDLAREGVLHGTGGPHPLPEGANPRPQSSERGIAGLKWAGSEAVGGALH